MLLRLSSKILPNDIPEITTWKWILSGWCWQGKQELMIAKKTSETLRGVMIKALVNQMKEEVATLCGPHYHPAPKVAHRQSPRRNLFVHQNIRFYLSCSREYQQV